MRGFGYLGVGFGAEMAAGVQEVRQCCCVVLPCRLLPLDTAGRKAFGGADFATWVKDILAPVPGCRLARTSVCIPCVPRSSGVRFL